MRVNRVSGLSAAGAALALFAAGCGAASTVGSPHTAVNIGSVAGFTGSNVTFSDEELNGVQAAAYLINQQGGILGHHVNVIPVNDSLDPVDAVPAVTKMLATDNVSMEVGLAALDYINALPVLNRAKMVSFSYIGPSLGHVVMPYHWNVNPSDSQLGTAMAYYAHKKGYKRIALVFDTSSGAQSVVPALKLAASRLHIQIVADPVVPQTAISYETPIAQVVQAHPQAVLMQVEPNQAGAFFQQWRSLGAGSLPIIATDFTLDQEWLTAAGAAEISHVVALEAAAPTPPSPYYSEVANAYKAATGQPISYVGEYLYDGTVIGALAMVAAHSTNPKVYARYVSQVTDPGLGHHVVYSYAQGVKLLKKGEAIKYIGITGPLTFNKYHRPTGAYGVFRGVIGQAPTQLSVIPAPDLVGLD